MNYKSKTTQTVEIKSSGFDSVVKTIYFYRIPILIFLFALLVTFPYKKGIQVESYPSVGQVSNETVIAPFTFDVSKTADELNAEKLAAENRVLPVFKKDSLALIKSNKLLSSVTKNLQKLSDSLLTDSLKDLITIELAPFISGAEAKVLTENPALVDGFSRIAKEKISKGVLSKVLVHSYPELESLTKEYGNQAQFLMSKTQFIEVIDKSDSSVIISDSLHSIQSFFTAVINKLSEEKGVTEIKKCYSALYHLSKNTISPTLVYDGETTAEKRLESTSAIKIVKRTILQNVEIVRKHQVVNEEISESLTALVKNRSERDVTTKRFLLIFATIDTILLVLGVSLLLSFYLMNFIPQNLDKRTYFKAIALMAGVELLIIRLGLLFLNFSYGNSGEVVLSLQYSAVPMTVATILASILFNKNSGLMLSVFFSIYIGVVTDFNLIASIGTLITGGTAAFIGDRVRYRKDFLMLVIWMMLVNSLAVLMSTIAVHEMTLSKLGHALIFANSDALISVLFVSLLLPLFEQLFSLTTDMTLMELADMNHPLLKQLSIEAPGTYNHSIQVANLAESAAIKVGADPLLCRVAAYYHDIGKMKKPTHFIENQRFKKNIHDKVSPAMSVRMISAHVREGFEMAEKYRLPKPIKDAITQHHGDSLIGFFYHKANDAKGEKETIERRDFSYPGPKPQSKETAILMVADSVEAISRTMKSSATGELREMVRKVVYSKIGDSQFDECGLTFNEANSMINGFMPVLEGIFHSRIEYPVQEEDEDEK
jgi:putative nucleotidyltransferase with HDIG domain